MKTSESIKNIAVSMSVFHDEIEKIPKTSTNPFFKSKYAALPSILDAIKAPLKTAGLTFMQFPKGENELETIVMHPESGEWMSESFSMKPVKQDPQSFGSVITYQRRYALGAIFGLNIDEDDDGNKGSEKAIEPTKKAELTPEHKDWERAISHLKEGKPIKTITDKYYLTEENKGNLIFVSAL